MELKREIIDKLQEREERLVSDEKRKKLKDTPYAVLLNIIEDTNQSGLDSLYILLERRAQNMSKNPGDMALPGGKMELDDISLFETATREANEEVGLEKELITHLGYMDEYVSSSGIIVRVAVSWMSLSEQGNFRNKLLLKYAPKTDETSDTVIIPLKEILDKQYYSSKAYNMDDGRTGYIRYFDIDRYLPNVKIWGMTATILRRFIDLFYSDYNFPLEPNV